VDFTEPEKQILIAIKWISRHKQPNRQILNESKEQMFEKELVDWGDTLNSMIERNLVCEKEGILSIAEHIIGDVLPIVAEWTSKGFSEWMIKSEQSKTYSVYCERLHGKDLCQCSMMNMEQLSKLLQILSINEQNKALDLGCGIGTITEYISDITNAEITGIDIASGAIKWAQERTKEKSNRLTFDVQNLDNLVYPPKSFDTLIAIDTLYFVNDLEETMANCKQILSPGGQMGIFYTQVIEADEPKSLLLSDKTKLAQALQKQNLTYQTWDYTEDEKEHWRMSKTIAEELKVEFEKEGYLELYKSRIDESEKLLKAVNGNRISRYLYHVKT